MANLRADNLCGVGFVSANDGTVWSNYITGGTLSGSYPATNGFDGNIANFVYAAVDGTMVWTAPNGGIKAGLIEIYAYAGNTHPIVRVNGVSTGAVVGSATPNQLGNWVDVTSLVGGHLKTITCYGQEISGVDRQSGFSAVRINGEILTDSLVGTKGGRNAIKGSVFFSGYVDGATADWLQIHDNLDDFNVGTGDFTFECWVKAAESSGQYAGIFGMYNYDAAGILVQCSNTGVIRLVNPGGIDQSGSTVIIPQDGTMGSWHHIAVARSGTTLKAFVNGNEEISHTYSSSIDFSTGNSAVIGVTDRNDYPGDYDLKGYISNLRLIKGTALYTSAFTPSTEELTAVDGTVLLCCQDTDDPTQEATGRHEIVGFRKCYQGKRYSNIATNGDLETGDTTGWTNGGCATFEASTNVVHSGSYSLHCVSDGNGDNVYYTLSLNTTLRYKISAYINCVGPTGTSAKAKMKIGTSNGGNQNYESQTANVGAGWQYVEWIGLPAASTLYVSFNESSANNVNDWYVDDLKVEVWYPEEGENILPNPNFLTGATGWSFSSTPSGEYTISSNRLNVTDTSRTNDAFATVQLFSTAMKEGKYKVTIDYVLTSDDFDIGIGNNRIFGVAGGGTYSGEGNSASVTYEIDAGSTNSSLRLVANQHCVGYFNNITLSRVAEPKRINPVPPYGVDAGVTFEGDTKVNSQSYMYFPTGDTSQRGRGTALFGGGYVTPAATADIEYLSIVNGGITTKWGNLSTTQLSAGQSLSSTTRQLIGGGWASPVNNVAIEYVEIATSGNSITFGNLVVGRRGSSSVSNDTRGIFGGGYISPADAGTPTMDYVTIASKGNAADFGDLSGNAKGGTATGSTTRAVFALGNVAPVDVNTLEYVTIATLSDYTNFGDLPSGSYGRYNGSCSSNTRGIFAGGHYPTSVNIINYITIASTGNAEDFGDLFLARGFPSGTSNGIRGVFMGGTTNPARQDTIDSVIIATTGNAVNWGDMRVATQAQNGASSDSHGGLS